MGTLWYSLGFIAPAVPVRKNWKEKERTGLHTLVTISATAITNLNCELVYCWPCGGWWWVIPTTGIFKRLPSPRKREKKRKKNESFFLFMIHFVSRVDGNFLAANVFSPSFSLLFIESRERERKRRVSVKWFWLS